MEIIRNLKKFRSLDIGTRLLLVEAYFSLGVARILVSLPFARIAPSLGSRMMETDEISRSAQMPALQNIRYAVRLMSRYTLWDSKCLVKAIAAMKMLERRRIESTLYLGTAKDESGKMVAHAWLRSGPFYICGDDEMARFTVVGKFAKRIRD